MDVHYNNEGESKYMKYEIVENSLKTESFNINFEYKVADVKYWDGVYVVLLSIPNKADEVDNIYGVDGKGNIIWRIENPIKAFNIYEQEQGYNYFVSSVYVSVRLEEGIFIGTTFFAIKYTFDYKTGKLISRDSSKW